MMLALYTIVTTVLRTQRMLRTFISLEMDLGLFLGCCIINILCLADKVRIDFGSDLSGNGCQLQCSIVRGS